MLQHVFTYSLLDFTLLNNCKETLQFQLFVTGAYLFNNRDTFLREIFLFEIYNLLLSICSDILEKEVS